MIRWFKGRKHKRKCYDSSDESSTEYGFKDSKSRDNSPYGFRKFENNCVQVADVVPKEENTTALNDCPTSLHGSSSPHIYDEIKDLPDNIIASQFRILTGLKFTSSLTEEDEKEGPYMVVPVLPARRIPAKSSAIKSATNLSRSHNDVVKESTVQLESNSDLTNTITHLNVRDGVSKTPTYESVDLLNCSRSETDSIALPTRIQNSEQNLDDSETEYDLNSGESTECEYPVFLDKIEQNLFLKQQVREIIQSLSRTDSDQSRCNRTDSFSTVSTESSSVPHTSESEVSDPDVFADQSESEDDNEYHVCTNEKIELPYQVDEATPEVESKNSDSDLKHCVQKQKKRLSKCRKPKFKIYSIKDEDHENKLQSVIHEDTEMYLLPSCKKEIDYYDYKTCRKPVLVPTLPTRIYQDPDRLKSNKNNKLLGDLIRMNYDKQHLILV